MEKQFIEFIHTKGIKAKFNVKFTAAPSIANMKTYLFLFSAISHILFAEPIYENAVYQMQIFRHVLAAI